MRAIWGILGLLVVVAMVGILTKKQLNAVAEIRLPAATDQSTPDAPVALDPAAGKAPAGNAQQQAQQIQQQFKAAAEAATQQARPMPDEK
jgi:hypothetical protein